MAVLTFTVGNLFYIFSGDYVNLCAGKNIYTMADRKLCACIADDLPDSVPNGAEVGSVRNSNIKVLH